MPSLRSRKEGVFYGDDTHARNSMISFPDSLFTWLVAALLLFWFVGAHNRLVRLRATALQAFGTLDTALVRQLDFVTASALPDADVPVPTVVVATSEDVRRAALQASARQFTALLAATRLRPLDPEVIAAMSTSLHVMLNAWQRMDPEATPRSSADSRESRADPRAGSPEPGSSTATVIPWPEPSATAEISRVQFNLAVAGYNAAARQFPAVLVAWLFRLRPAAPVC